MTVHLQIHLHHTDPLRIGIVTCFRLRFNASRDISSPRVRRWLEQSSSTQVPKSRQCTSGGREGLRLDALYACCPITLRHDLENNYTVALPRFTAQECDLGDGTSILPGYMVAIDMKAIHFDPTSYPDPERCDLFRFSKLRDAEETDTKYGFATVDNNVSSL